MTGDVENLVLEQLRAIRAELADVRSWQREHTIRFNELYGMTAGLRRDQAHDAEVAAHLAARVDRLQDQVERINHRLDLRDQ